MKQYTFKTLLVCATVLATATANAAVINFESGFVDLQPVGTVNTPGNQTTFSVTGGGPAIIAQVGNPTTAFVPNDNVIPAAQVGNFFLTDERAGPNLMLDYFMSFANPIANLALDLLDFRGDGGPNTDTATLTVYSDANFTNAVGSDSFTLPGNIINPDGNIINLSVLFPSAPIRSASLTFALGDVGTGIDNITFQNAVPEPTSLAVWAVLGLVGAGVYRRQRRKAQ